MKKHIFLIGFMGCGKSTNAKRLAEMTGRVRIFRVHGEPYFRDLETKLVNDLAEREPSVVSCGGGTVLREENVAMMKTEGVVVLLTASPETVYERIHETGDRPVLKGNMNVPYIRELMEKRRPSYEAAADFRVATDGKTSAERFWNWLRRRRNTAGVAAVQEAQIWRLR